MSVFNLSWGNSVCVRESFLNTYHGNPLVLTKEDLSLYNYPEHSGDPELVEITRKVIKRQTGQEYKHVFLVNGATGGVMIALRAMKQRGVEICITRKAPYYVKYPLIINTAGLEHVEKDDESRDGVNLVDWPSNPLGLIDSFGSFDIPTIVDGVYLNNVYMSVRIPAPFHDIMIGSYSKLTGINGIRVGWLATNDSNLARRFDSLVTAEYCGLDTASSQILRHTLKGFDWPRFEALARLKLDMNREEWSRLEKFFGGTLVSPIGMFYYSPMDKKAQEIFAKAGVVWTKGSDLGANDGFARFNLGAKNEVIKQTVKAILKADRR